MNSESHAAYKRDIERNTYVSHLKKKRWVLFFLRFEQGSRNRVLRKLAALGKKVALAGTGCELPAGSLVGAGIRIPHLNGIVISPVARVGIDCVIFHQVTLGVNGRRTLQVGPVVCDRVPIGAGAKLIGPILIGDDVSTGANAIVTKDVPAGATVVGFNRVLSTENQPDRWLGQDEVFPNA